MSQQQSREKMDKLMEQAASLASEAGRLSSRLTQDMLKEAGLADRVSSAAALLTTGGPSLLDESSSSDANRPEAIKALLDSKVSLSVSRAQGG
jgi:hypothetical protein